MLDYQPTLQIINTEAASGHPETATTCLSSQKRTPGNLKRYKGNGSKDTNIKSHPSPSVIYNTPNKTARHFSPD